MSIFKRQPALPTTSYNYQPPIGATARGWACTNDDCGTFRRETVSRWPKACSQCGCPADPLFDEPWAHDARGLELYQKLLSDPDAQGGFAGDSYIQWRYRDALLRGDLVAAETARKDGRDRVTARLATQNWYIPGNLFLPIVLTALDHHRVGDVADELRFWSAHSDTSDIENNNSTRTNLRQIIEGQTRFLLNPLARTEPAFDEIWAKCVEYAAIGGPNLMPSNYEALHTLGIIRR